MGWGVHLWCGAAETRAGTGKSAGKKVKTTKWSPPSAMPQALQNQIEKGYAFIKTLKKTLRKVKKEH